MQYRSHLVDIQLLAWISHVFSSTSRPVAFFVFAFVLSRSCHNEEEILDEARLVVADDISSDVSAPCIPV